MRQLTNSAGEVTDTYEYDAFGNSYETSGSTPNNYLYRGEQWDSDLGWARLSAGRQFAEIDADFSAICEPPWAEQSLLRRGCQSPHGVCAAHSEGEHAWPAARPQRPTS